MINEIEDLTGLRIEHQVLLRYEREGLVSGITRGSGGRGVGRWVDYSHQALFQVVVAVQMIHGTWSDRSGKTNIRCKFEKNVVRMARNQAIFEFVEKSDEERKKIRAAFVSSFSGPMEIFVTAAVNIYFLLAIRVNEKYCSKKGIQTSIF